MEAPALDSCLSALRPYPRVQPLTARPIGPADRNPTREHGSEARRHRAARPTAHYLSLNGPSYISSRLRFIGSILSTARDGNVRQNNLASLPSDFIDDDDTHVVGLWGDINRCHFTLDGEIHFKLFT